MGTLAFMDGKIGTPGGTEKVNESKKNTRMAIFFKLLKISPWRNDLRQKRNAAEIFAEFLVAVDVIDDQSAFEEQMAKLMALSGRDTDAYFFLSIQTIIRELVGFVPSDFAVSNHLMDGEIAEMNLEPESTHKFSQICWSLLDMANLIEEEFIMSKLEKQEEPQNIDELMYWVNTILPAPSDISDESADAEVAAKISEIKDLLKIAAASLARNLFKKIRQDEKQWIDLAPIIAFLARLGLITPDDLSVDTEQAAITDSLRTCVTTGEKPVDPKVTEIFSKKSYLEMAAIYLTELQKLQYQEGSADRCFQIIGSLSQLLAFGLISLEDLQTAKIKALMDDPEYFDTRMNQIKTLSSNAFVVHITCAKARFGLHDFPGWNGDEQSA